MIVHTRARFIYLNNAQVIQNGQVNEMDIVVSSPWCRDRTVALKTDTNHVCTFSAGDGGSGSGIGGNGLVEPI